LHSRTMTGSRHILVVEDGREISSLIGRYLRSNECRVSIAANAQELDQILTDSRIDLIVLDIMLPGEDGLSLCRRLRAASDIPIMMVTAKGEEVDRILGLVMGADDYPAKPSSPRELLARIKAVLRRTATAGPRHEVPSVLAFIGWQLDLRVRQLKNPDGARVPLTGAEFDLLQVFCKRPGRVLSRDQLLDLTRGLAVAPYDSSIDVLVSGLRQKIERDAHDPQLIMTVGSGGYMFTPEVSRS
jgi:two-component system OmpR family response regulator